MTFVTGDITDIQRIVQWPNVKYFGLIYITVPDETTHFYSSLASAGVSEKETRLQDYRNEVFRHIGLVDPSALIIVGHQAPPLLAASAGPRGPGRLV